MPLIDDGFFASYAALQQEVSCLDGSAYEKRFKQANSDLDERRRSLRSAQAAMRKVRAERERYEARILQRKELIALCQTSSFFGITAFQPQLWLRGGVSGKIQRQEKKMGRDERELAANDRAELQLSTEEQLHTQRIDELEQSLAHWSDADEHKSALRQQVHDMFDIAVHSAATPALHSLEAEVRQQRSELNLHAGIASDLPQTVDLLTEALQQFHAPTQR